MDLIKKYLTELSVHDINKSKTKTNKLMAQLKRKAIEIQDIIEQMYKSNLIIDYIPKLIGKNLSDYMDKVKKEIDKKI